MFYNFMKINFQNINFKGYDAAPLKSVYFRKTTCTPIIEEMQAIAKQEGFEIKTVPGYNKWIQDEATIVEKDSKVHLVASSSVNNNCLNKYRKDGMDTKYCQSGFIVGGDMFIGKYPDGRKWMITGRKFGLGNFKTNASRAYGIDEKNIFQIPKQNFHIDMFMRPIGYPYILVNDFSLVDETLDEVYSNLLCDSGFDDDTDTDNEIAEFEQYKQYYEEFKNSLKSRDYYCDTDTICKILENHGFKPIKVAGVYGDEINFMNAIVNKHQDGTMSYITNSSDCPAARFYSDIQRKFEMQLKKEGLNISNVYFVQGNSKQTSYNYMMDTLLNENGGIHCMCLEEPDFEAWA